MYEYKFVKIEVKWKLFSFKARSQEDHQEVINSHAKEDWRLVQIFAPEIIGYGQPSYFELIFEKEMQS